MSAILKTAKSLMSMQLFILLSSPIQNKTLVSNKISQPFFHEYDIGLIVSISDFFILNKRLYGKIAQYLLPCSSLQLKSFSAA